MTTLSQTPIARISATLGLARPRCSARQAAGHPHRQRELRAPKRVQPREEEADPKESSSESARESSHVIELLIGELDLRPSRSEQWLGGGLSTCAKLERFVVQL